MVLMGDPREDSIRERMEEREMWHEAEILGLRHIAHLPHDWKEKREERIRKQEDKKP
jgi:hypothetical protein